MVATHCPGGADRHRAFLLATLALGEPSGTEDHAVLGAGMGGEAGDRHTQCSVSEMHPKFPLSSTSLLLYLSEGTHRSFFQHVLSPAPRHRGITS